MKSEKSAVQSTERLLQSWSKYSANVHKCKPGAPKYEKYKTMLGDLLVGMKLQVYLNQKSGERDMIVNVCVDLQLAKHQRTEPTVTSSYSLSNVVQSQNSSSILSNTAAASLEASAVVVD